jgi:hypothetical protein
MTTVRVYVPSSRALLRELLVSGGIGPVPIVAHAVTPDLREALSELGEEELEYAVLTAAAQDSLGMIGEEDDPRRVVVVAEAESAHPAAGDDESLVELDQVVPLRRVVSVHVDDDAAADDVAAARLAWKAAEDGDAEATATVERCLDHELGWFATQEIGELLDA